MSTLLVKELCFGASPCVPLPFSFPRAVGLEIRVGEAA